MIDQSTIQAIADLLTAQFQPEQIILFGSHARGEAHEGSDLDLLVVLAEGQAIPRRGNPLRRAIAERFTLPVDVILHTPESHRKQRKNPYSLASRAIHEGVVLYDKSAA